MRGEVGEDVGPLPEGVGAEAVDEEEVGLGRGSGLGDPAVDDGAAAVAEVGEGGAEAGLGECQAVAPVPGLRQAEAPAGHLRRRSVRALLLLLLVAGGEREKRLKCRRRRRRRRQTFWNVVVHVGSRGV